MNKTTSPVFNEIEALYSRGLKLHGPVAKSVGWRDENAQTLRFHQLSRVLPQDDFTSFSLNDFGCGYAALFSYMQHQWPTALQEYHGYDLSLAMIEAAGSITDGRCHLHHSDAITTIADYSMVSGTFNVKANVAEGVWAKWVLSTIVSLATHSRRGFAINCLSTFVDRRDAKLYYGDPAWYFNWCKNNVSPYVTLVHDYPLYEWTLLVRLPKGDRE